MCDENIWQTKSFQVVKVELLQVYCLVFDGMCPPLSTGNARLHLCSLLPMLKEALDELYSNEIAHMDVCLENNCFKSDNSIQLIDLNWSTCLDPKSCLW